MGVLDMREKVMIPLVGRVRIFFELHMVMNTCIITFIELFML